MRGGGSNERRRATQSGNRPSPRTGVAHRTRPAGAEVNGSRSESLIRESRRFPCPICGHDTLEFTHAPHRDGGGWTVLVHCWNCNAGLDEIAAENGIPRYALLKWPPPVELGQPTSSY